VGDILIPDEFLLPFSLTLYCFPFNDCPDFFGILNPAFKFDYFPNDNQIPIPGEVCPILWKHFYFLRHDQVCG